MQVICLDSDGTRVCELSPSSLSDFTVPSSSPRLSQWINISEIKDLRPAQEHDFLKLPLLHQGFIDSHIHPCWMARLLSQINLKEKKLEQITKDIESENKNIFFGYGWDEELENLKIDEVSKHFDSLLPQEKELYFFRKCGHSAYVSKAGKKKLNITHSDLLKDKEIEKIPTQFIEPDEFLRNFQKTTSRLLNDGISTYCDLLISQNDYEYLNSFDKEELEFISFGDVNDFCFFKDALKKKTPYIKIFLDGSLGSQSAWLSQSYEDNLLNNGIQIWSDETLFKKAEEILDQNFLLAFHAIGDAAVDQALRLGDRLGSKLEKVSQNSRKFFHRLEHLQVCRDDQIEKIKKQGFWSLGLQPFHRVADSSFILKRLGERRMSKDAYRLKSFIDAGLRVSLGSDAPIVSSNPIECIKASTQDPRLSERLSLSQSFELMITEGRLNSGFGVKKLTPHTKAFLSYINS